jgi:hypothetical protein
VSRIRQALWTAVAAATLVLISLLIFGAWKGGPPLLKLVNILTTAGGNVGDLAASGKGVTDGAKLLVDDARPRVNKVLDQAQVATWNASRIEARWIDETRPLINANLIHLDGTLGNFDRFSENQEKYNGELLATAQEAHKTATALRTRIEDPAVARIEGNLDRTMMRMADAAENMADVTKHVDNVAANGDKKVQQVLFPIRTAKQKLKAAGEWIGKTALEIELKLGF